MINEPIALIRLLLLVILFSCRLEAIEPEKQPFVMGSLKGQFGNQLFIIAATTSLALDHGALPIFPDLVRSKEDNIPLNYKTLLSHLNVTFPRFGRISYYYNEPHFHFAPIPYRPNICLIGYFQSEKYFAHHKNEILELFAPPPKMIHYLSEKYGELLKHPETVSVHIRYYADSGPERETFSKVGRSYIEKAIAFFSKDALFLVFSNQIERCKKELSEMRRNLYFIEGESHYHDFYLMSLCKHNITCNSSFSWWAAYLNHNPEKKVIAPYPWFTSASGLDFKDLVPEEWILVPCE